MSTFSRSTFNATKYSASRPHYPPQLYRHVLGYAPSIAASSTPKVLVDVGCGPGLSTFGFAHFLSNESPSHFDSIIGVDPSKNMIDTARSILADTETPETTTQLRFEQAKVDELDTLDAIEPESVDLVVAGQAAHWFDPLPTYASLAKILKPGGAFVFWGYGEIFFPDRPELSALIPPFSGGLLGPYWEQPGRSIVENLLIPFPLPISNHFSSNTTTTTMNTSQSRARPNSVSSSSSSFSEAAEIDEICSRFDPTSFERSFFLRTPPRDQGGRGEQRDDTRWFEEEDKVTSGGGGGGLVRRHRYPELLLTKEWTLKELRNYLDTWSSLHKFREEKGKEKGGEDIVEELIDALKRKGWDQRRDDERLKVGWEVGMVMGKKKKEASRS